MASQCHSKDAQSLSPLALECFLPTNYRKQRCIFPLFVTYLLSPRDPRPGEEPPEQKPGAPALMSSSHFPGLPALCLRSLERRELQMGSTEELFIEHKCSQPFQSTARLAILGAALKGPVSVIPEGSEAESGMWELPGSGEMLQDIS